MDPAAARFEPSISRDYTGGRCIIPQDHGVLYMASSLFRENHFLLMSVIQIVELNHLSVIQIEELNHLLVSELAMRSNEDAI